MVRIGLMLILTQLL